VAFCVKRTRARGWWALVARVDVGAFGFAPNNMAHFAWSKTETTIQVHGIGPFSSKLVDPAYELSDKGGVRAYLTAETGNADAVRSA
jgi:hypothetical protein